MVSTDLRNQTRCWKAEMLAGQRTDRADIGGAQVIVVFELIAGEGGDIGRVTAVGHVELLVTSHVIA